MENNPALTKATKEFNDATDKLDRALRKNAKRRGIGSRVKFK